MTSDHLPREPLGFFPTPLIELPRLTAALGGPRLFMKRDDQTGLAFGGNKTRKLEYILAQALAEGADTIVTAGAAQSNHCRQTAAAAAQLGLACHLVLGGDAPEVIGGNLLLDHLFGSHIHWAGPNRKGEDIPRIVDQLTQAGNRPHVVPYGGSNELGALSFVEALKELDAQQDAAWPSFTHIVLASSSGGTHAGLMLGQAMLGLSCEIVGIQIDKSETDAMSLEETILTLANRTADLIGVEHRCTRADLILDSGYLGAGYGVVGDLEREAIVLTARTEGILLDPVYTGRAMGGLIDMIRTGRLGASDRVLFWHTGGAPALFAHAGDLNLS